MEGEFGSPCGGCRQSLVEFENFPVHLMKLDHLTSEFEIKAVQFNTCGIVLNVFTEEFDVKITSTLELLPLAFTPAALK